jgi:outer membrane protein
MDNYTHSKKLTVFTTLLMLLTLVSFSSAQVMNSAEGEALELSLDQAIEMALTRNYDIQLRALDSEISFANLNGAFGIYDITLSSNFSWDETKQRQYSTFQASESNGQSLRNVLSKAFQWGTRAQVTHNTSRDASDSIQTTLNPSYRNSVDFSVEQPLLKDFGSLATERTIMVNRNSTKQSEIDFESQIIATVVDVKSKYLNLVSSYEALKVAEDSLELAKQQLEKNKFQVEIGTLPEIEIIQAEQAVAQRESELLDAQTAILQAQDNLKAAIVMDDWGIVIVPTDELTEPDTNEYEYDKALQAALDNRPEVRSLDISLETNDIQIQYSENQLKPTLNLQASLNLYSSGGTFTPNFFGQQPPEGLPLSYFETVKDSFGFDNYNWALGAAFTYVFGNEAAEANLAVNKIRKRQNQLQKDKLRYTIAVDVRDAIRELESAEASLEARRKSLLYAERQYEAEKQKFEAGTSTNFEVLNFQNGLVNARNLVILAQIRYNRALIQYDRATGTLLSKNNIEIETTEAGISGASVQ